MIRIDPLAYLFFALLILTLPLDWLIATVCVAVIHELSHILAITIVNGRILSIRIGIGGAVIETDLEESFYHLLCAMAGPAGSFLLVLFRRSFPKLAICAMVQGIFNCLPIYPLDGGRAMRCIFTLLGVKNTAVVFKVMEVLVFLFIMLIAFAFCVVHDWKIPHLLFAVFLCIKLLSRKRPCKQHQNGVQ